MVVVFTWICVGQNFDVSRWYVYSVAGFNPAEAEDGFRSNIVSCEARTDGCFNPAEAEDGFRSKVLLNQATRKPVSIQPKPKTGLEVVATLARTYSTRRFNPAEAEDGFRSNSLFITLFITEPVSIQPKPKTGLEVINSHLKLKAMISFNPAEAEDGFRRRTTM